jgi:arylsulfatase A-like enzyme
VPGHPVCAPYRASLFTGKYTTSTSIPQWMRAYYAMAANLDWNFCRLLAAIEGRPPQQHHQNTGARAVCSNFHYGRDGPAG